MTAVFRHSASKGSARLVLLAMADEADGRGMLTAYRRSQSWLARKANVDGGTVRRAIASLIELGEVELLTRGDGRESSDYRLHLPGLEDSEGVQDAPPAPADDTPRGGETRAQGAQDAPPIIPLFPVDPPVSPSSAVSTRTSDQWFDEFWKVYPRRAGKGQARPAWKRAVTKAQPEQIIAAAAAYRDDPNREASYTKHPSTWLNGECWNDPPLPPRAGTKRTARESRIAARPDGPRRFVEALGLDAGAEQDQRSLPPGGTAR